MSDAPTAVDAARAVLDAGAGGGSVALATCVAADGTVRRLIVHADGTVRGTLGAAELDAAALDSARELLADAAREPLVETVHIGDVAWTLLVEAHHAPERLIIVGAGHIAVPLAHIGRLIGFRVTVLDDREEFATTERFDDDVVVRRADFATDPFAGIRIDEHCWIALVTRGHRWDFDCLQRVLRSDARPRYIGMIGSRRRVRAAFHALLTAGTPRHELARIRAPIGIEISAETPEEIAVSIAAELIAVRRGAEAGSISARERVLERLLPTTTDAILDTGTSMQDQEHFNAG